MYHQETNDDDFHNPNLPEFFKVFIRQHSFHRMLIPKEFVEYIRGRKVGTAELIRSGKNWRVELVEVGNDLYFADGWMNFVNDNLVRDGEFLFFTLHGDLTFSVVIYDESMCEVDVCEESGNDVVDTEEEQTGVGTVMAKGLRSSQQQADQKAYSVKPSFEIGVTRYKFIIPKEFVREHSLSYKSSETMVLRTSRDSSWKLKIINTNGMIHLSGGWRAFYDKNCFKAGDICKFELIDRLEMMVQVVAREEGNIETMVDVAETKTNTLKRTDDDVKTVTAKSLRSSHPKVDRTTDLIKPSFEKCVTQSSFTIPKDFVNKISFSYKDGEKMVLRTYRNSSWDVKILNKDGRIRLSSGWSAFLDENYFKAGDFCRFELLARLEMMVHKVSPKEAIAKKKEDVDASKIMIIPSKRAADEPKTSTIKNLRLSHPKVDETTDSLKPSFKKGITISSFDIPKAIVLKHSLRYKTSEKMILRTSSNTHWEAKIIQKNDRLVLSRGWRTFLRENCLNAGDICNFEFINRLEMMVHVTPKERNIEDKVTVATSMIIPSQRADLDDHGNESSESVGISASVRARVIVELEAELKHLNDVISQSAERRKEVKGILRNLR